MLKKCFVACIMCLWFSSYGLDAAVPPTAIVNSQGEEVFNGKCGDSGLWSKEDEGDHFPCTREWWNIDTFFGDGHNTWSVTASMGYEMETFTCNMFFTLFNGETGQCYRFGSFDDPLGTLLHKKNEVNLTYGLSTMRGLYPRYCIHLEDKESILSLDMDFYAETKPQWVTGNITDGFLPMGMGFYRYGFISRCSVTGTMYFEEKTVNITGKGYYEHVWGNWSYHDPLMTPRNVSELYGTLIKWWRTSNSFSLPSSIALSSDNNPFGYDWIWATFENNWSLFYGNLMFWIMEGPALGILYLEKDGHYNEFVDISFKYEAREYNKEFDIYYPLEIIIEAKNNDTLLSLHFTMTAERNVYIDRFNGITYWQGLGLWEAPGIVTGYYNNGGANVSLQGKCEIEPQRLFSPLGHNQITITRYPETRGISINITSHLLATEVYMGFHLLPRPRFYYDIKHIERDRENNKSLPIKKR